MGRGDGVGFLGRFDDGCVDGCVELGALVGGLDEDLAVDGAGDCGLVVCSFGDGRERGPR